ncbi:hypothetical protein J3458_005504 [Metarhizium acridum]|uniref:uncharacterized protein n=1 Tax=Metarhizium acridum TaxID=92637 RepID=UPI001C6BAFB4|nr:hypothetical protein J3458_005504 [Metarhizium acridum]
MLKRWPANPDVPRTGEDPNPFQLDSPIIRTKEKDNLLVNGCGRTKLQTNIDVANETEIAIQNNQIAGCKPGDTMMLRVHVVNTDGSGPFFADIDEKSNVGNFREIGKVDGIDGKNGIQRTAATAFDVAIPLPSDMKCEGGKDLNVCTLRIRNLADAGPFGGCVALQDLTGGRGSGGQGNNGQGNNGQGNNGQGNNGQGNNGQGNNGQGNGGQGNGGQGNGGQGNGGQGNGGQGNGGQGNGGQGNGGQGNGGQGNGGQGNGGQGNGGQGNGGQGNGGQGNGGQGNGGQGNRGQGNNRLGNSNKNAGRRRGTSDKRAENTRQGGQGGGTKNTGTGNKSTGNGNKNTGTGNQNTGNGNKNTGNGNKNTGNGNKNNGGNQGERSPDDITTADTLETIQSEQKVSLKNLADFVAGNGKNGGNNPVGNPQDDQNNINKGQNGGNQNGGNQNGGNQNGGNQNGGNQNGGNQNGGNQNGGNQKGGNQNGGSQRGGSQRGGSQNGAK